MYTGTTSSAANYPWSHNLVQQHDIAYGHGISTNNPTARLTTGQNQALDRIPGPHSDQPLYASETPVGHFRDLELDAETADVTHVIDPALIFLGQASGIGLDNGSGLHQDTENPISDIQLQLNMWLSGESRE